MPSGLRALAGALALAFAAIPGVALAQFALPPLPYAASALEPHIDTMTMEIHHGRHHQAFITALNAQAKDNPALRPDAVEATLREISRPGFFDALAARTRGLVEGLGGAARAAGVPLVGDSEGGMFGFFFTRSHTDGLPQNYGAVMATDKERFNRFFHAMLDAGVYLAPALYEAGFVSAAHSEADIAATLAAARQALR